MVKESITDTDCLFYDHEIFYQGESGKTVGYGCERLYDCPIYVDDPRYELYEVNIDKEGNFEKGSRFTWIANKDYSLDGCFSVFEDENGIEYYSMAKIWDISTDQISRYIIVSEKSRIKLMEDWETEYNK